MVCCHHPTDARGLVLSTSGGKSTFVERFGNFEHHTPYIFEGSVPGAVMIFHCVMDDQVLVCTSLTTPSPPGSDGRSMAYLSLGPEAPKRNDVLVEVLL